MIAERASTSFVVLVVVAVAAAATVRPRSLASRTAHDTRAEVDARVASIWVDVDAMLARIDVAMADLDRRIAAALDEHVGCPSPREHSLAVLRLEELKRQQAELRRRLEKARRDAATICRLPRHVSRRVIIDTACIENPLARGCM